MLPGLVDVNAKFDGTTIPAYSDHWVSNVFDREGFLTILRCFHDMYAYVCMYVYIEHWNSKIEL